jgi:hypothetical protein
LQTVKTAGRIFDKEEGIMKVYEAAAFNCPTTYVSGYGEKAREPGEKRMGKAEKENVEMEEGVEDEEHRAGDISKAKVDR